MDFLPGVQDQFLQMEWADALVWKAVLSSETALSDDALRGKLHHIHLVQRGFLAVWQREFATSSHQQLVDWINRFNELRGTELMEWGKACHRDAQRYLAGLSDTALAAPVVLPWADEVASNMGISPAVPTLAETLIQVVMHSAHHCGQVATRLRELGAEPPLVDFIAWVWLGKPAAQWPK